MWLLWQRPSEPNCRAAPDEITRSLRDSSLTRYHSHCVSGRQLGCLLQPGSDLRRHRDTAGGPQPPCPARHTTTAATAAAAAGQAAGSRVGPQSLYQILYIRLYLTYIHDSVCSVIDYFMQALWMEAHSDYDSMTEIRVLHLSRWGGSKANGEPRAMVHEGTAGSKVHKSILSLLLVDTEVRSDACCSPLSKTESLPVSTHFTS